MIKYLAILLSKFLCFQSFWLFVFYLLIMLAWSIFIRNVYKSLIFTSKSLLFYQLPLSFPSFSIPFPYLSLSCPPIYPPLNKFWTFAKKEEKNGTSLISFRAFAWTMSCHQIRSSLPYQCMVRALKFLVMNVIVFNLDMASKTLH